MEFPFKDDNKVASGIVVEAEDPWCPSCYEWDVYRFRNAATGEWLTACIGYPRMEVAWLCSILHIVKGAVYPDVSYERQN